MLIVWYLEYTKCLPNDIRIPSDINDIFIVLHSSDEPTNKIIRKSFNSELLLAMIWRCKPIFFLKSYHGSKWEVLFHIYKMRDLNLRSIGYMFAFIYGRSIIMDKPCGLYQIQSIGFEDTIPIFKNNIQNITHFFRLQFTVQLNL